jgi:hypothetical protein
MRRATNRFKGAAPAETRRCLLIGAKPTSCGNADISVSDPDVWSGRALQVDFAELAVSGLASMYPVSDWSCFAPDHHGYQRACDLVNGQASTGHLGHQCSHAPGRPNLHLVSSSRRPRLETVDRVTSSLAPHFSQFLCSSLGPFLRPDPQNVDRVARRGGQGRPSRLACGRLRRARLRLDRAEHGVRIKRGGRCRHRRSSSARRRVL